MMHCGVPFCFFGCLAVFGLLSLFLVKQYLASVKKEINSVNNAEGRNNYEK